MTDVAHSAAVFLAWAALFLGALLILAYRRSSLSRSSCVLGLLLLAYLALGTFPKWWKILLSIPYASLLLLNIRPLRLWAVTRPFLRSYRRLLPPMSATEREALDAGTVWWDGELFTGGPDWQKLMSAKVPALTAFLRNFPSRPLAAVLRLLIFPRGLTYFPPSDRLGRDIVDLIMNPTAARERLTQYIYKTQVPNNPLGLLQEALILSTAAESLEKRIRVDGVKTGRVTALDLPGQILEAVSLGILSEAEAAALRDYDAKVSNLLHVDDFAPHELSAGSERL
jgi:hypothetical protein